MGEQLTEKLGLPDEGASSGGWAGTPPSSLSGIAGWSAALLTRGRGTRSALPRAPAAPVPRGHRRAVVLYLKRERGHVKALCQCPARSW